MAREYAGTPNVVNPDDPVFYNPGDMREAFDGYFKKTGQPLPEGPEGYFRCAYDSLVYSFRYHIELIEKMTGKRIKTIHMIGGGCQSKYLTGQTAAICQRKVVSGPVEAATFGNILVQGMAMGILPGLDEARKRVLQSTSVKTYDPQPPAGQDRYEEFLIQVGE
jgi:sugar (pentulose or hexulose) kinase